MIEWFYMKKNEVVMSKLLSAVADCSPTDFTAQLATMMAVLHDELLESVRTMAPAKEQGQVYARPYQIAERWGYTDGGVRRFLYSAEQSGKVRVIQPTDVDGVKGQKLYHLGDVERFFNANK